MYVLQCLESKKKPLPAAGNGFDFFMALIKSDHHPAPSVEGYNYPANYDDGDGVVFHSIPKKSDLFYMCLTDILRYVKAFFPY